MSENGQRRKTDEKLKSPTSEKSANRVWSKFFSNPVGLMVPVKKSHDDEPRGRAIPQSKTVPAVHFERTMTRVQSNGSLDEKTSLLRDRVADTSGARARSHDNRRASHRDQEEKSRDRFGLIVIILAIGLGTFAYFESSKTVEPTSAMSVDKMNVNSPEFRERVEFHRKMTGWKLNRERIGVEVDNINGAPGIEAGSRKVKGPDIMAGVPLEVERHHREGSGEKTWAENPSYADARIRYGLQEEQDKNEWDKRVKKAWVDEFVSNAAAEGLDVQIDNYGNVKVKPIPDWQPASGERNPTSEDPDRGVSSGIR